MLALAATYMAGQTATGIHLEYVRFKSSSRLEGVDLKKCAADLKSITYVGQDWTDFFAERLRAQHLQENGYFNAKVRASTQQLGDKHGTHQFSVIFSIDAGPRYRLGHITFKNNRAVSNPDGLRDLVPIKDGDIFEREPIAKGLENLRYAYRELGYINFTAVPSTAFDDEKKLGFLEIYVDEGKQFSVSSINILGADPSVMDDLLLKPGDVYNVRLVELFLRKHWPGTHVDDPKIIWFWTNDRER
jgi:hypothetical protein